jgi:PHD/YefM family antitoxin component YafN of YafNO toxin-antitoxin module
MTITHQTVVDSKGKPAAALIPWAEFLLIQEIIEGGEATEEEADALREAEADRRAGNHDAFTDLASLKAELSL